MSAVLELMLMKGLLMMLFRWSAVMSSFSENARARSDGSTNWLTWKFPCSGVTSSFRSHLSRYTIFSFLQYDNTNSADQRKEAEWVSSHGFNCDTYTCRLQWHPAALQSQICCQQMQLNSANSAAVRGCYCSH